jgi:hypothetical protein
MIGERVVLKERVAKWMLDHPDIYEYPNGTMDDSYETETLMHLMCCIGVPMTGAVVTQGADDCWGVQWKIGKLTAFYYVQRRNFEVETKNGNR